MGAEIGRFLRTRRGRITPHAAGLSEDTVRRRVPGLRREELARLAGVSSDYYMHLEQGRATRVSDEVLFAIGRVLGLTSLEQQHLLRLARRSGTDADRLSSTDVVDPPVRSLLDAMTGIPAYVLGRRTDIIAWNSEAAAVFDFNAGAPLNLARRVFSNPATRARYPSWPEVADPVVTRLRLESADFPGDRELADLVDELLATDDYFRRLWLDQYIEPKPYGTLHVRHPVAGDLVFEYQLLAFPQSPGQTCIVLVPRAGTGAADRLRHLLAR